MLLLVRLKRKIYLFIWHWHRMALHHDRYGQTSVAKTLAYTSQKHTKITKALGKLLSFILIKNI